MKKKGLKTWLYFVSKIGTVRKKILVRNQTTQFFISLYTYIIYIRGKESDFFLSNDVKLKICSGLKISTLPALLTEMFGSML